MPSISLSDKQKTRAVIVVGKYPGINYKGALGPTGSRRHARSTLDVAESKGRLRITITAKDATALRASINSMLRDLQIIEVAGKFR